MNRTIYKQWHRKGFMSLKEWWDGSKVVIEIGELGDDGGLKQAVSIYSSPTALIAQLDLILADWPNYEPAQLFGGGRKEGVGPISRVFTMHPSGEDAYWFNASIFKAKVGGQGQFIPEKSDPLAHTRIKATRSQIAEMRTRLNYAIIHAVRNGLLSPYLPEDTDGTERSDDAGAREEDRESEWGD